MAREAVTIHKDHFKALMALSPEESGAILQTLISDLMGENAAPPEGFAGIIYDYISRQIERFDKKSDTQAENGAKGGRPKASQNPNESQSKPKINPTQSQPKANRNPDESQSKPKINPTQSQPKANRNPDESPEGLSEGISESITEGEAKDIVPATPEPRAREARRPPPRFVPPELAEVEEYCAERSNAVNAAQFVDFYAAKGWRVGNQPMRDWRAAVRTWERREADAIVARASPSGPGAPPGNVFGAKPGSVAAHNADFFERKMARIRAEEGGEDHDPDAIDALPGQDSG